MEKLSPKEIADKHCFRGFKLELLCQIPDPYASYVAIYTSIDDNKKHSVFIWCPSKSKRIEVSGVIESMNEISYLFGKIRISKQRYEPLATYQEASQTKRARVLVVKNTHIDTNIQPTILPTATLYDHI